MKQVTGCLLAMTTSMLVACAANPPAAPTPTTHETAAAAASAAPPKSDFKIPAGYRQAMINGQERFCRKSVVTGSRVSNGEVCLTAAQLQAQQEQSESALQGMQRAGANKSACTGGAMGAAPAC